MVVLHEEVVGYFRICYCPPDTGSKIKKLKSVNTSAGFCINHEVCYLPTRLILSSHLSGKRTGSSLSRL